MPFTQIHNSTNVRNNNKQNSHETIYQNQQNKSPLKFTSYNALSQSRKLNCPSQQLNIMNQLKIKIADKQFQLKKLEQDQSIKMTQIVKELQKQKMQKKQAIKQWKQKLQEEVEYCNKKLEMAKQQYQGKIKKIYDQQNQSLQINLEKQKFQLQKKFQQQIEKLTQKLQKTNNQYQQQIRQIKCQNNQKIQSLSTEYSLALQSLKGQFSQQIQLLKLTHSKQILFYHQLQKTSNKQHKAVQIIFANKIKCLQQELIGKNIKIRELSQQISDQRKQNQQIKREKQNLRLDNICWQRRYDRLWKELKGQFDVKYQKVKEQFQKLYQSEKQKFIEQLSGVQKLYDKYQKIYQSQIQLKDQRAENLLMIFNTSKSKQEDLKKIEILESKLMKKQIELQKQHEDLKICRLELNNMDQLFQKMFQQAKLKSSKTKKIRLPSLMAKNLINRSTMDVYEQAMRIQKEKQKQKNREKKFSIRDYSYQTMAKQVKQFKSQAQQICQ